MGNGTFRNSCPDIAWSNNISWNCIHKHDILKMKTPNPNQEALDVKKEIEKLDRKIMKLEFAKAGSLRKLVAVCIHNEIDKKYEYEPGGYLDRCKYINKIVCKTCGKVIEEEVTIGGFN